MAENIINLPVNHKRSLTSTLKVVENLLEEVDDLIKKSGKNLCTEIVKDVDHATLEHNLKTIEKARVQIRRMTEKYGIVKSTYSLQRIIDYKKSKMWEILCDANSKKMKGYGDFPKDAIKDFDEDIDQLMAITQSIKIN
ncbi:MAG: hypothetical protein U5K79_15750 [Cyclobacteriaceae bacterium]|nr:hypothetical protein [Cyclobacteriaceae bacterium]